MSTYEVSVDGRNLVIGKPGGGTRKSLAFYATLLVEARDPTSAENEALDRVRADPHVAAVAVAPPDLAIDSVAEIPATGPGDAGPRPHGPIFCFFEEVAV